MSIWHPLLNYDFFKIWPWNPRVKVIDEVTVQSHNMGITSYRLTSFSFHVNRPSHSWDTAFSNFDLKNQGSRSWVWSQFKSHWWSNILSTHILFVPCQWGIPFLSYDFFLIWPWKSRVKVIGEVTVQSHNVGLASYRLTSLCSMSTGPPIPEIQHFQNLTLKIKGQGQMTKMLHNYRSRQFHRTLNGINPSSGFKDMGSAKSGPSAAWFDKFLAHGQNHMGQMGK